MTCLSDREIQAAVDGEATAAMRAHLAACASCRERVDRRRADFGALASAVNGMTMSAAGEARIRSAIAAAVAADQHAGPGRRGAATADQRVGRAAVRGATALRAGFGRPRWPRAGFALAVAAGVLFVVYLVLPHVGAPTSLSASEVLGRSLQTLSAAHGIERLEYELTIGGARGGTHRVEQLVDYDHPNRFRLATYGADGEVEKAISQDPFTGRRTHLVRLAGRNYVFSFTAPESALIPIPELAQAQLESVISMMQATSDQKLTVVDGGRQYIIQMPPVAPRGGTGMLDLYAARAVIDGSDFRVHEFEASGALLKQPYTVSFRLIRRTPLDPARVTARDFAIEPQPGDVLLSGEATPDIFGDLVGTALRALAASGPAQVVPGP